MRVSTTTDPSAWPELWQAACRILEQTVVPNQIRAWIQPLEFQKVESGPSGLTIEVVAPNDFSAQWIRDHYIKSLSAAFTQITGQSSTVVVSVSPNPDQAGQNKSEIPYEPPVVSVARKESAPFDSHSALPPTPGSRQKIQSLTAIRRGAYSSANEQALEPKYIFENFVVGASNQFAHAAAVSVAEHPASQYNPLFIYSYPGLGKTHLLHAIGNHFLAKNPEARVAYLSAERFVNELIESLQHHRMPEFRSKYRDSYDLILIDDIQFIAGKAKSEEEFFHTFNALHSSKRQMVVTSDRPPKEIQGLEERVRTRFEWGLISDIAPPEIETRIAILKAKAEHDDIYLPDEVATFIASYIKTNVRELEGVLIRLQAQASLTGAEISLEMAKHELKISVPEEGAQFTLEAIQVAVSKHFQLRIADLKANTRARSVALPRQIAMYLIRKYTGLGFKEIGNYFGGKDHTTILHACHKIEVGMESDGDIRSAVESIQNLL